MEKLEAKRIGLKRKEVGDVDFARSDPSINHLENTLIFVESSVRLQAEARPWDEDYVMCASWIWIPDRVDCADMSVCWMVQAG